MKEESAAKLMLLGAKESFLIRALEKKLSEEKIESFFVTAGIDEISRNLEKASILVYYLDSGELVKPDLLHFLNDLLTEQNRQIILIGEKNDTDAVTDMLRGDVILRIFPRPLDTEAFIGAIAEYSTEEAAENRKKSILIVDDDVTYLGVIRDWLKRDYRISMANSGMQAIRMMATNHVDLVLLDHEMPVTSGPQVLQMMRSETETKHIPVIFLTGKSDRASVMQAVELKPEGYLLKTIDRETLLQELKKFFQKKA